MRTFVECRRGSDEALYHRHIWQEVGNAYDSLASAIQTGNVAAQAKESARLDEALIAADIYSTHPAPEPVQLPPKLSADEARIAAAAEIEENSTRKGPGYRALRTVMPILRRLAVW